MYDSYKVEADKPNTSVNPKIKEENSNERARLSIPTHWGLFARFSDDPEEFLLACRERKLRGVRAEIYEQLDLDGLLKGAM